MIELKLICNQCPIDDDRFVMKIEMKGSGYEATNPEMALRAFIGKVMRKALKEWCDGVVRSGAATHFVEVDIDGGEDDEPEDPFTQPNQRY